jgi:hypothetical protein
MLHIFIDLRNAVERTDSRCSLKLIPMFLMNVGVREFAGNLTFSHDDVDLQYSFVGPMLNYVREVNAALVRI